MATLRDRATGKQKSALSKTAKQLMKKDFGGNPQSPTEHEASPHITTETISRPLNPGPDLGKGFQYIRYLATIPALRNKEGGQQ